jgi:uncharacterized membrane protein YphA (DoxX/SURF4 family)
LDEGSQEESGVRDQQAAPHHDRPPGGRRRQIRPLATVGYWLATLLVAAELGLGGIWDIERLPMVRDLVTHLGSPSYFLVLLGIWKVLGAVALLVPRRGLLKEWAYAGAFFTYTGAIASPPHYRLRPRRAVAAGRADRTDRRFPGHCDVPAAAPTTSLG